MMNELLKPQIKNAIKVELDEAKIYIKEQEAQFLKELKGPSKKLTGEVKGSEIQSLIDFNQHELENSPNRSIVTTSGLGASENVEQKIM